MGRYCARPHHDRDDDCEHAIAECFRLAFSRIPQSVAYETTRHNGVWILPDARLILQTLPASKPPDLRVGFGRAKASGYDAEDSFDLHRGGAGLLPTSKS